MRGIFNRLKNKTTVTSVLYTGIVVALVLFVWFKTDISGVFKGYSDEHYLDITKGFTTEAGSEANLRELIDDGRGEYTRIYQNLPEEVLPGESINLCSHNCFFNVYVDGRCIYVYEPRENLTGYGTGDVYHSMQISPEDAGKELVIEVNNNYGGENGGRITNVTICSNHLYNYLVFRERGFGAIVSGFIIFLGLVIIFLHFLLKRQNFSGYNLIALGMSSIILGGWTLVESSIVQLLIGMTAALRVLDYSLLLLMTYPLVCFVTSITKEKKPFYRRISLIGLVTIITILLVARIGYGMDLHNMQNGYLSYYGMSVAFIGIILYKNRKYCQKEGIDEGLKYFYIGAAVLLLCGMADGFIYAVNNKEVANNGTFLRIGLLVFISAMLVQIVVWFVNETRVNKRDNFVNALMQHAISGSTADATIQHVLEYLGNKLNAERVYIYENKDTKLYCNSYGWEKETGIQTEDQLLEDISDAEFIEGFYFKNFKEGNNIIIRDRKHAKKISPVLYKTMMERNIHSIVIAPIRSGSQYIGFLGVMNSPKESLDDIADILKILEYFISETIRRRGTERQLIAYSYYDQLTGVKNRRALHEFERDELDVCKPYGFIMCDINGLKKVNDTEGHEAGDCLITDISESLGIVYGMDNVYRMGGDEFAVYDLAASKEAFLINIEKLGREIELRGRSASLGYVYRSSGDIDFEKVKREADDMMYKNKAEYYSTKMDRRKR